MRLFVIPRKDVIIRHPKTKKILPQDGFWIDLSDRMEGKYWQRRLKCGDIINAIDLPKKVE
jgi:hypothetical protein